METFNLDLAQPRKVLGIQYLTKDAFVLTMERRGLKFDAGRHIAVGVPGDETREYSIYSGEQDDYLQILVRRVTGGRVSKKLADLQPGDPVMVRGPKGRFRLSHSQPGEKLLFVATGTGVAPFRCFLRSQPHLDYTLVHGVRRAEENFGSEFANPQRLILCLSKDLPDRVQQNSSETLSPSTTLVGGRVTHWLEKQDFPAHTRAFLCGNEAMLNEVYDLLITKDFTDDRIHREKYF